MLLEDSLLQLFVGDLSQGAQGEISDCPPEETWLAPDLPYHDEAFQSAQTS